MFRIICVETLRLVSTFYYHGSFLCGCSTLVGRSPSSTNTCCDTRCSVPTTRSKEDQANGSTGSSSHYCLDNSWWSINKLSREILWNIVQLSKFPIIRCKEVTTLRIQNNKIYANARNIKMKHIPYLLPGDLQCHLVASRWWPRYHCHLACLLLSLTCFDRWMFECN